MAKWLLVFLILCAASVWSQTAPLESVEQNRLGHTSETDKQIQALQDHVKEAPGDYAGYDGLGSAFLQKARETGDIAYYDLAEQTLKKALALAPQDFRASDPLVHMASVYMGEHRFLGRPGLCAKGDWHRCRKSRGIRHRRRRLRRYGRLR